MKAAADVTLAEVRRKISETNNSMKLIGRLRKLRQLRKDQAERKGLSLLSVSVYYHVVVTNKHTHIIVVAIIRDKPALAGCCLNKGFWQKAERDRFPS